MYRRAIGVQWQPRSQLKPLGVFALRTSSRHNSTSIEAGDFIDIDMLAMMDVSVDTRRHPAAETEVLGVVRTVPDPEGTEYSRFGLPLDNRRNEKTIPRHSSRALLQPGEEAVLFSEELRVAALEDGDETRATSEAIGTSTETTTAQADELASSMVLRKEEEDASAWSRWKDPTTLPYDDEQFAETLLKMEVDGVIDETWQDAHRAHLEDVKEIKAVLQSLKVRDICCIDVSSKTGSFDYIMFGTCEGSRHIHLAAWAAQEADSMKRVSKIKRQQTDELWEVVPIGRILLNLMVESLREDLTLERKWAVTRSMDPLQAANAPVSESRQVRAHGLWTLTLNLQDLEAFEVDYCKDTLLRQA